MAMDFTPLVLRNGSLLEIGGGFPCRVSGWDGSLLTLPHDATHFGMVTEGQASVMIEEDTYGLRAGMFFVAPARCVVTGVGSKGLVISLDGYVGLRQIGGPLEPTGRLCYIDGCSDTLLVCPPRLGEPCLNHLHIPPGVSQTAHTHPSERIGVILRGRGECRTPGGVYKLEPGMGWRIPPDCLHSFYTTTESLDVIAWHPDSDFGPTDWNHPMANRTLVKGVSASHLPDIQTQQIR